MYPYCPIYLFIRFDRALNLIDLSLDGNKSLKNFRCTNKPHKPENEEWRTKVDYRNIKLTLRKLNHNLNQENLSRVALVNHDEASEEAGRRVME